MAVDPATHGPVSFRGVPYERVLNTTRVMSRSTYQTLLLESLHASQRWENQSAPGWSVSQLDTREMVLTLEEAIRRGRSEDPGTRDPQEILRGLGLLVAGGQVSRAAVALFCKGEQPLPDFMQLTPVAGRKPSGAYRCRQRRALAGAGRMNAPRHTERTLTDTHNPTLPEPKAMIRPTLLCLLITALVLPASHAQPGYDVPISTKQVAPKPPAPTGPSEAEKQAQKEAKTLAERERQARVKAEDDARAQAQAREASASENKALKRRLAAEECKRKAAEAAQFTIAVEAIAAIWDPKKTATTPKPSIPAPKPCP